MNSFSRWDREAYHARVGEEEAARRRGAIMAEQLGYQLTEPDHENSAIGNVS